MSLGNHGAANVWRFSSMTALYLVGGLAASVAVGSGINEVTGGFQTAVRTALAAIAALFIFGWASTRWADMALEQAGTVGRRGAVKAGASISVGLVIVGLLASLVEPAIVGRAKTIHVPVFVAHATVFTFASFVVGASGGLALALQLPATPGRIPLAVRAGVAAALGFIVLDLCMIGLGWRVGAPDAARRATMLVVTAVGAVGAALAAGFALGRTLSTPPMGSATPV